MPSSRVCPDPPPTLSRETHYLTLDYMKGVVNYLRARDHDAAPVLSALGVTADDLGRPNQLVDARRARAAFSVARRVTADDHIGMHVGQAMHPCSLGALGHLLLSCASLQELIEVRMHYEPLITNSVVSRYEPRNDGVHLFVKGELGNPYYSRQRIECHAAWWVMLVRGMGGPRLNPEHIVWPFARPDDDAEARAVFGCDMDYQPGDTLRFVYPAQALHHPLWNANPHLRPLIEPAVRRLLQDLQERQGGGDSVLMRARRHIADALAVHVPDLEATAHVLGMSPRQLQRHLERHHTSYRDVLDGVRRDLATQCLADDELPLADISLLLGFAEQSTFQRASRRWFGCTPMDYRRARFGV